MTEDITSLQIKILYDSVDKAEQRLRKLEVTSDKTGKGMKRAEKSAGHLMGRLLALAGAYITLRGVIAGFQAVIRKTAEFEQLNAQLLTATGSAENAAFAFEAIKKFAQETPYDLQQATGAFISLVNRGLTPSERALRSYGDTASSMGFSLADMVLAVSNATAGEFENLKKFGIRAKKEGDNVKFIFRGVATEVGNNIDEIEKYFIELGEKNFADGMTRQMDTINGAISNFEDAWEVMLNEIGESGIGEAVEDSVRYATALVEDFTDLISSGALITDLQSWAYAWQVWGDVVVSEWEGVFDAAQNSSDNTLDSQESMFDTIIDWIKQLPLSWKFTADLIGSVMQGLIETAKLAAKGIYDNFKAQFDALINTALATGKAIGDAMSDWRTAVNPLQAGANVAGSVAAQVQVEGRKIVETNRKTAESIGMVWEAVGTSINSSLNDYDAGVQEIERLENEANRKREDYAKNAEKRNQEREDALARFRVGGSSDTSSAGAKSAGAAKKGGGSKRSEFDRLAESLENEETLIAESYIRRLRLIQDNTRQGSEYQAALSLTLTQQFEDDQLRQIEALKGQSETMFEAYARENELIREAYEKRREIILGITELTEAQKLAMLEDAQQEYTAKMRQHETERNSQTLQLVGDFFGDLSEIAGAFGKKGAKIAKAAAIAQATVKTYESANSAYASLAGIPYVGPALGAAAAGAAIAAGLANIQKIRATDDSGGYAGAYKHGGLIPAGKYGMVGEAGPELVQGPALVTSAENTRSRYGNANQGKTIINIHNYTGAEVETRESQLGDDRVIETIIKLAANQAERQIGANARKGGSSIARDLEAAYPTLRRVAR